MQAELCSHIGLQGNHFCRMCHVGGDQAFKSSNEGFPSLMVVRNSSASGRSYIDIPLAFV